MKRVDGKWLPTITETHVLGFFDNYRWLSNFHVSHLEVGGIVYTSGEAAYQALKTLDSEIRKEFACMSPNEAEKAGQQIKLRPDWDALKDDAMFIVQRAKYRDPELAQRLLDTGDLILVETNYWNDTYWGQCRGHGKNMLGITIMERRARLRQAQAMRK